MKDFAGKVAVITGGGGGIGRALAQRFTAEGMKAAGMDVTFAPLEEVADLCLEGIRNDTFWITVPNASTSEKIQARATSQIERTAPLYLLAANLMTGKKAGAAD